MASYELNIPGNLLSSLLTEQNGLAQLVEAVLNQILEAQTSEQVGAQRYERSEERVAYRNGCRPRQLFTRIGPLTLRVPQMRDGQFSTEIFARYQRSEQALVLSLMEMVVNGVSTRKVTCITEELCGASFSKSTVSQLCLALDGRVTALPTRLVVGLHYLKHAFNESDESVVAHLMEKPYWQYSCGFEPFLHRLPRGPSSLVRWRKRVRPKDMEQLLAETLETAKRGGYLRLGNRALIMSGRYAHARQMNRTKRVRMNQLFFRLFSKTWSGPKPC